MFVCCSNRHTGSFLVACDDITSVSNGACGIQTDGPKTQPIVQAKTEDRQTKKGRQIDGKEEIQSF